MAKDKPGKGATVPGGEIRTLRPPSGAESEKGLKPDYDKSWAVVIGIDGYHHVPPLTNAVKDADGIARLLVTELGFPKEQVLVTLDPPPRTSDVPYALFDTQASKEVIERVLFDDLPKRTGPEDRVIIFFAGHGRSRPLPSGGETGYLLPVGAEPEQWSTYIPTGYIVTQVGNLCRAKHIFYLLDACYSGLAFEVARDAIGGTPFEDTMLTHRALMALTAGTAEQVVSGQGPV